MQLSENEREQLHATLLNAFSTINFFERLAQKLGLNPHDFEPTSGITDRMSALIIYFEAQDNIETLLSIPPTVPGWENNIGLKAALEIVHKSYVERKGSSYKTLTNPFDACFLEQDRPFINRDSFRDYLKELSKEKGKRFLVVNGPLGSGRTHSHYLIEALAPYCNYKFCFIELENEVPTKYYPDIMARRIDRDLRLPMTEQIPTQQNVGERWAQELCDWLVEKILLDNNYCWIVLDGFGNQDIPDETKRLVASLIDAIDKRLPKVRLVLLDYTLPLPRKLRPFVNIEDINEISQEELNTFFKSFFYHAQIEHEDKQIRDITMKVFENLTDNEEERMFTIMTRVMEIKNKLS
jgi:hypothetical protein